jgi:hypothetical protein
MRLEKLALHAGRQAGREARQPLVFAKDNNNNTWT